MSRFFLAILPLVFAFSTPHSWGQEKAGKATAVRPSQRLNDFLKGQAAGLPEAFRPVIGQDELTHASTVTLGGHTLAVEPLVMYPYGGKGKAFAGMKLECRLDGKLSDRLSLKGLEFAETAEAAGDKIYGHWWRVQAMPALSYLQNNPPAFSIGDVQVWTPVVTVAKPAAGDFPGTVENHKSLVSLATKAFTTLKPGEMHTVIVSHQTQPPFALTRNWDGGWLVDETSAKKSGKTLPVCAFTISTGSDPTLGKAMEKLLQAAKVKEEFAFGYILVKKAP